MAAKKQKPASSLSLRGLLSWLFGPGRSLPILVALVVVFGGGVWFAWAKFKDRILGSSEYRIGPEQVEISPPQPPWIPTSDIRAEVFRSPALDGSLSIMDDGLADRIAGAFARHPWVANVSRVTKQYGAVKVELAYRKPVCMVEVPGGVQPIDAEGVLLPSADFSSVEVSRYPRLLLHPERGPTVPPGSRWGDPMVVGGAEIAAAILDVWEPMRFRYIEPLPADPVVSAGGGANVQTPPDTFAGRAVEPFFVIVTRTKTRVLWGYAPGAKASHEFTAAEKVARLKRYLDIYDTLDGVQGPHDLDIRNLPPPTQL
jgi:hypothetical protein